MSAVVLDRFPASLSPQRERHLRLVPAPTPGDRKAQQTWRLTRRGRLAVTVTVAVAIVATLLAATLVMAPASASDQVVVRPGQTLSEIAATHLPHLPLDRAIVAVQRENRMSTLHIQAGQTLVIP
jgi:hypothetical protein